MKICRNCGTANVSSGQACFKCGANLSTTEESAKATICGNCSSANAIGAHYCYNCGQSLKPVTHFCNSCGAINRPGDIYCLECGRKILLDNPTRDPRSVPQTTASEVNGEASGETAPVKNQGLVPLSPPIPVNTDPIKETVAPSYRIVPPPGVAAPISPPQTKHQYRIQIFLMFAGLLGMLYLLTQTFFTIVNVEGVEINGIAALLIIPMKFVADSVLGALPSIDLLNEAALVAGGVANTLQENFATIFAYLLFGVISITAVALVLGAVVCLFRLIFNKPYNNTRRGLFYLCLISLLLVGFELLAANVEFVGKIFLGEGTFGIFEPQQFFYIFAGGLFALFVLSRIARVKVPRITKRQKRRADKKAEKKVAKKINKQAKKQQEEE